MNTLSFQRPKAGHNKAVGRIFEISNSNPIRGKCRKSGRSLSPQKKKTRVWGDSTEQKRGNCGKCEHENAENAKMQLAGFNVIGFR